MTDSNILIACHCNFHKYQMMYHMNQDGSLGNKVGEGAIYIDPHRCPEKEWSSVKPNSIDFVWGEECSVYFQLDHGLRNIYNKSGKLFNTSNNSTNYKYNTNKVLFHILNESYRVLKNDGKVIFGDFGEITDDIVKNVELLNKNPQIHNKYRVEVVPALGYQLYLVQVDIDPEHDFPPPNPKNFLYVFTKQFGGGSRRTRRRRNKSRRNNSSARYFKRH